VILLLKILNLVLLLLAHDLTSELLFSFALQNYILNFVFL
jgi:hypothetical protein